VEAFDAVEIAPWSKRTREGLLHRIPSPIDVAEHRDRKPEEAPIAVSVRLLDRSDEIGI